MLAGTSAAVPAGPSGRPMSPAESTSAASEPRAWPSWPPNSAPPSVATIDCIGPSWARASSRHQVAHGADHPAGDRVAELAPDVEGLVDPLVAVPGDGGAGCRTGSADAGSSHRSARRSASSTALRSYGDTAGSPAAASWLAATWRARSQLTGPLPGAASSCCSCAMNCCICAGRWGRAAGRPGSAKPNGISGTTSTVRGRAQVAAAGVALRAKSATHPAEALRAGRYALRA